MGLVKPLPAQIAKIKVVGIGGGGGNTVNFMAASPSIRGVDYVAINTDAQALLVSRAKIKVQIGEKLTRGLGAGGNPEIGNQAAQESQEKIKEVLQGTDIVFITGGMGGGTCSGAAEVVAQVAKKELGTLTVAVVTKPFLFEGTRRMVVAEDAIEKMKDKVDTLIVIPNQKLLETVDKKVSVLDAFKMVDSVLSEAVQGIADLIVNPGLINLDFADVQSIMKDAGTALMGVGYGRGEGRAQKAIKEAISSPLLDITIEGARGVLFNITASPDLAMSEVEEVAQTISQNVGGDANIIFGAAIDKSFKDQVKITVIATGFDTARKALAGLVKPQPVELKGIISEPPGDKKPKDKEPEDKISFELDPGKAEKKPAEFKHQDIINNEDLPPGVEINDELDIPAFLRKGN